MKVISLKAGRRVFANRQLFSEAKGVVANGRSDVSHLSFRQKSWNGSNAKWSCRPSRTFSMTVKADVRTPAQIS